MKKPSLLYTVGFLSLLISGVFIVALIFLQRIKSEVFSLISVYGYLAIFIIAFLVDILVQPLGPELPLIASKTLKLSVTPTLLLIIIATTLASFFSYRLGKLFYPIINKEKKGREYLKSYHKYGRYGLLVAALGPIPYVPFCWFSGTFKLPIKNFLLFGIIPRILRILFVSYILFLLF